MKQLKKDQVYQQLLHDIGSGKLAKGSKLPIERELSKQMRVGIVTLRSALERLEKEGRIERIRSQGTFVAKGLPQLKTVTGRIGCLLRPYENNSGDEAYFDNMASGIYSEIMKHSHQVIQPPVCLSLKNRNLSPESTGNLIAAIEGLQSFVDGFILDERVPDDVVAHFENRQSKPMVVVNRNAAFAIDSVVPVIEPGVKKIVNLSLKLNYENFVVCKVERNAKTLTCFDNILKGLHQAGIKDKNITVLDGLAENSLAEFLQKFNNELTSIVNRKTVFFAGHEGLAKFICGRLKKQGFKLGETVGVAGYFLVDENHTSDITTIQFSPQALGEQVVSTLFDRINNNIYDVASKVEVPVNLFIGETL